MPYKGKYKKSHTKTINLKCQLQRGMKMYSVSDIEDYFKYLIKKHETVTELTIILQ